MSKPMLFLEENIVTRVPAGTRRAIDLACALHDGVRVSDYLRAALYAQLRSDGLALRHGLAGSTAGGSHHGQKATGAGFCIFNDVAVAALALKREGVIQRALVIDLDVHQGDGTA